jgi:hypothetical protein
MLRYALSVHPLSTIPLHLSSRIITGRSVSRPYASNSPTSYDAPRPPSSVSCPAILEIMQPQCPVRKFLPLTQLTICPATHSTHQSTNHSHNPYPGPPIQLLQHNLVQRRPLQQQIIHKIQPIRISIPFTISFIRSLHRGDFDKIRS